jgi:hypothetical protein
MPLPSAAAGGSVFSIATAAPHVTVVVMIVFVITAAVAVVVIIVPVPVAIVNNNVMPGPHRSLCSQLLLSLFCPDVSSNATGGVSAARRPLLPLSMQSLFPWLLPLTSHHGHDLLLCKSLF